LKKLKTPYKKSKKQINNSPDEEDSDQNPQTPPKPYLLVKLKELFLNIHNDILKMIGIV
jgi:hypothetical protein